MISPTQLARCLGDEHRLGIVCLLFRQEELCVCDLVSSLEAPQPTVSRHLAQLRGCGLVVARREGTWMHYRLNPALPAWARDTIGTLVAPAEQQLALSLRRAC
ncbi:MAG: metalloregulator ArsR/SmtB family transcription factor [Xanthomonadales bacterium]|jgi:ArsR family transcriptional regulator|nr:metalloregulator ArsR/SmtB family transcription factor [Xanthomonadales bacterium]